MEILNNGEIIFGLILLFVYLPIISIESNEWIYGRNKNMYCHNNILCTFIITNNNPFSPMIPTSYINHAILGDYFYIYFTFIKPDINAQKIFYLEAYDIKLNQTVISNGDCYLLNLTMKLKYELRIYKQTLNEGLIQLQFLGLNPNFFMNVEIRFPFSSDIYIWGFMLTKYNSLWKREQKKLIEYLEQLQPKIIKQNERKIQALEKTNQILKNLFGKVLSTDVEFNNNYFTTTIPIPPIILVTISITVGINESTEKIFKTEEKIISETVVLKGEIQNTKNIFDFLGENINIDNNIKKLIELLDYQVNKLIFSLGLENDSFSLTISYCFECTYIDITLRFFDPVNNNIYFEIDIKIEITNELLLKPVRFIIENLIKFGDIVADFNEKYPQILDFAIGAVVLLASILFFIFTHGASAQFSLELSKIAIIPLIELPIFSLKNF